MMPTKYMRRLWKSALDLVTINRRRGYCIAKALVEENLVVSQLHGTFALKRAFADHLEDPSNFLAFKAVKKLFLSLMEQRYGPDFISLLMPDILDWLAKLEDPRMLRSDGMIVAEHAWMLPDEGRFWFGVRLAQILTMEVKGDLAEEFFRELYELSIGIDEQHPFFEAWHDHARKVKKTMGPGLKPDIDLTEDGQQSAVSEGGQGDQQYDGLTEDGQQSAESEGGQGRQQYEGGRWIAMINRHGPLHWRSKKLREIADGNYHLDNVIDLLHFELPTYMPEAQEFFWRKQLWHLLDMDQFFPKPIVYPRPQVQMSQESKADPSAFKTYPQLAGTIRKNGFIVIKNRPCKVVAVSTLNHGKCHFVGIDIFNGKKLEDIVPSSHNCDVPYVTRTEFQLIDISEDGYVSLLTESGNTKDDLKLPTDEALQAQIKSGYEEGKDIILTVQSAMGEEQIVTLKESGGGKN